MIWESRQRVGQHLGSTHYGKSRPDALKHVWVFVSYPNDSSANNPGSNIAFVYVALYIHITYGIMQMYSITTRPAHLNPA